MVTPLLPHPPGAAGSSSFLEQGGPPTRTTIIQGVETPGGRSSWNLTRPRPVKETQLWDFKIFGCSSN
jgi:hypothetical protein